MLPRKATSRPLNQQVRANDRSDCAGRKTVAIAKQRLGADNKVTGILLSQLGNLYRDTGRFAERKTC
jgi:hypothetical protein